MDLDFSWGRYKTSNSWGLELISKLLNAELLETREYILDLLNAEQLGWEMTEERQMEICPIKQAFTSHLVISIAIGLWTNPLAFP